MAPNQHTNAGVCIEDARSNLSLDSYEFGVMLRANSTIIKQHTEDVVIFFDWDDTLMASSAIAKLGLCPKYINEEPDIPDNVQAAETGWVELSASLFMPRLVPYLNTRIKVISARSTYEYLYPDCPHQWKIEAFNKEVFPVWEVYGEENLAGVPRHIISLGDGPTEREALINVKMQAIDVCHGKSMKFIAYPKISELQLEVELILANMEHLCTHEGDLDLQITWEMLNVAT